VVTDTGGEARLHCVVQQGPGDYTEGRWSAHDEGERFASRSPLSPSGTPGAVHYKGDHIPAGSGELLMAAITGTSRYFDEVTGARWQHTSVADETSRPMQEVLSRE
jgi:hypothetical protein